MPADRITIKPSQTILDLLASEWPLEIPKHRLMRLGLEAGLRVLADLDAAEFKQRVIADAVESAGIRDR